jgi:hypothetical protein
MAKFSEELGKELGRRSININGVIRGGAIEDLPERMQEKVQELAQYFRTEEGSDLLNNTAEHWYNEHTEKELNFRKAIIGCADSLIRHYNEKVNTWATGVRKDH